MMVSTVAVPPLAVTNKRSFCTVPLTVFCEKRIGVVIDHVVGVALLNVAVAVPDPISNDEPVVSKTRSEPNSETEPPERVPERVSDTPV